MFMKIYYKEFWLWCSLGTFIQHEIEELNIGIEMPSERKPNAFKYST